MNKQNTTQIPTLVQDRKTGQWYNPDQKMKELFEQKWFQEQMKRMANK